MTRRFQMAAGSLVLLAALAASTAAQTRQGSDRAYPMPKTLTLNHATLPIWVDASVALTEDGKPDRAVWGEYTGFLTELMQAPAGGGCREVGAFFEDAPEPPPRGTIEDAITHSQVALLGRVTDKAYGFYSHAPGQLFQIEPLRSYGYPLSKPRYYFFVPIARFRIGGTEICKTDDRYAEPPAIGDEVFLFVLKPGDPTGVLFDVLDAGDVVPVAPDGLLRLPRQYAAGGQGAMRRVWAGRTKADLLGEMRAMRAKGVPR